MLTKKTVLLAKIESIYGTDPTPAEAANAVMAYEPEITVNADMKERNPGNSDLSRFPELRGKTFCELKFSTELKGSGTPGTASRQDPLFQACGLSGTVISSTSITRLPLSSSMKSCTIWIYIDGLLYKVNGCIGDLEIDLTAGEMGKLNWTFKGLYSLPTDVPIVTPTFDATVPNIVKGAVMTFGSYSAIIEKLTLKLNNDIAERPDFNQTEGVKGFQITGRNPEGSMTIEAVLRATSNADFLDYFHSRTVKALSFVLGATGGNIITITANYGYCRTPKIGDKGGIRNFEIPFQLARGDGGNNEISIVES
jgi:hypothetical protein